ncbi:NAD(P)H-dependent oxidoreductase [Paracoccus sp. TK19116]|uniref:NAD(P)H-dependent oxidoreductase n=1 Tax=Paracoccus albicereus TaxID=2922394 RepID=A0ABT1MTL5_9RHOB|nr:NAD(P)H-dependent oxidoreductase [Paracoccus albicereus]MCQ0970851.1 NAD(P)H-dependent oxidoreductase [Paracoccus albicereus]
MKTARNIAIIQGSIREGRLNDTITAWTRKQLEAQGFTVSVVDPADPQLLPIQTGDTDAVAHLQTLLAPADGYVVVTPEFNHSAPGQLKTLIDSIKAEWKAKPVGFVSYGGISGGLRAVEALRPVFAELHAMTLRDSVSFAMPWGKFDEQGQITDPQMRDGAEAAMAVFGDRLRWWVDALVAARAMEPYDKAAA